MDDGQSTSVDLREYIAILRARKVTVIVTMAIVVGLAFGITYLQTPIYESEARVLLEPLPTDPQTLGTVASVDLETQSQLISSVVIATLVREDLNLQVSADVLLDDLSVEGLVETQVVEISYSSSSPQEAQAVANSFANTYLDYRRDQALEQVAAEQQAIQARIESATQELTEVTEDLQLAKNSDDSALAATFETQRSALIARLGVLQQQMDDLQAQRITTLGGGDVIAPATLPEAPASPNLLLNILLGLIVGAGTGVALAFLRERLDDRFKDRTDVERTIGAPVLATVPRYQGIKGRRPGGLITMTDPDSLASEAYKSLRTNLQFTVAKRNIRSLLTTSAATEEGKTVTTANLALALAQAGRRVILVSADLRRPTIERYFGLESEDGLSSWLMSPEQEVWDFIRDPGIPNIRIIPSGPIPANPAELLASPRLRPGIKMLEENCDLLLIDSPPILAVADAAIIASHVGGAMLVTDAARTHRSAVIRAKEELERVGGELIGCVFNRFDLGSAPYYYQPYYYRQEESRGSGNGPTGPAKGLLRRKRPRAKSTPQR